MMSMTGFGRSEVAADGWNVVTEAFSVNRKLSEVVINLPKSLQDLEGALRKESAALFSRGRLTLVYKVKKVDEGQGSAFNFEKAEELEQIIETLQKRLGRPLQLSAADFLKFSDFLEGEAELDSRVLYPILQRGMQEAMRKLVSMRRQEGEHLREDLLNRLQRVEAIVSSLVKIAPEVPKLYRKQLHQRLEEAGLPIDLEDHRVLKEVALFADKCDISEELERMQSHFVKFRELANSEGSCGRELDFICQEMYRELNTTGSKANEAKIAHFVVEAKGELERIREQVHNAE